MSAHRSSKSLSNAQFTRLVMSVVLAAALLWILSTAAHVLLPLVFAVVIGIVFAPLSDVFDRLGLPPIFAALAVLLIVLSTIVSGIVLFYPVISELMQRIPLMWFEVQDVLRELKSTMEDFKAFQDRLSEALSADGEAAPPAEGEGVVPSTQDILSRLPVFAGQAMIFVGILYFFLLVRTELYELISRNTARMSKATLCHAEAQVSRYFLTVTTINAVFGVLVALMLSAIGMPNAIYWGVAAFLVNFVLYLGPIFFAVTLLIGGIFVFDGFMSFVPAALYLMMNMTEGQFVTPSLVGRHMKVNPLLVFVSLITWMWLWGPLGGVIAIPVLVWFRQIHKALATEETGAESKNAFGAVTARRSEVEYGPAE